MSFDSSGTAFPVTTSWNNPLPQNNPCEKSDPVWPSNQPKEDAVPIYPEEVTIKVEPLPSFHVDSLLLDSGGSVKPEEEIEYVSVPEVAGKRRGRPRGSKNVSPIKKVPVRSRKPKEGREALSCDLCRRNCPDHLAQDVLGSGKKFGEILGMELELRSGVVCRTCLRLVELLGEFKVCCLKAKEWLKERNLDETDGWFSAKTKKALERTTNMVRGYVTRMEAPEEERYKKPASREKPPKIEKYQEHVGKMETNDEEEVWEEDHDDGDSKGENDDFEEAPTENGPQDNSAKDLAHFGEDYLKQFLEDSFQRTEAPEPDATPAPQLNITVYTCDKCQRRFDSKIGYCYHIKICRPDAAVRGATLHTCPICSADFTSLWLMRDHLNKHRGVRRFTCRKECKKKFYTELARRSHEKNCSNEATICPLCGIQLKSENSLGSHMSYIHGEANIPCETCGKMFKARKALLKHLKVHSDARNYPCQVCGKAFKSSWTVKVHMRVHTQEKPFQCSICGQSFAYKCILKSHLEQTHGSNHI